MSWPEVLEGLERSLAEAEQRLAGDVWERPAPLWNAPLAPLGPLSPPEAARLHELSERCDLLRRRFEAAMAGISAQLDGTRRLRQGAHGYLMTQNLRAFR
jgi:hypothetical protein